MESHDLWIFKHVAELQSVSKAAEQLGYVQPNVSQRIKSLEDELGVRLFIRSNRGVTLTEEGNILLEYTNQIILLMNEAKSVINSNKSRETLTIGATQTISVVKIPQLFSSFLKEYQNIDVKLRTNDKQKLLEMLSYGELDGVFINEIYHHSQFETVYSYAEKVLIIFPKEIQTEKKQNHTLLINSDPNCIYRKKLLDFANKSKFISPTIMEFDSLESIIQAVNNGIGISIVPEDIAINRIELKKVQYQKLSESIKIDFVIKQRKQQPNGLKKFLRFLQRI